MAGLSDCKFCSSRKSLSCNPLRKCRRCFRTGSSHSGVPSENPPGMRKSSRFLARITGPESHVRKCRPAFSGRIPFRSMINRAMAANTSTQMVQTLTWARANPMKMTILASKQRNRTERCVSRQWIVWLCISRISPG